MTPAMKERFQGCLLGVAIGDALGGKFEGQTADAIRQRFPTVESLIHYPQEEIWYTDDTQMTIAIAETLLEQSSIQEEALCAAFVANYVPSRGYGRGARAVLNVMEEGGDYRQVAESHFPGGSYGNGAAMRVAPIGLYFCRDREKLLQQARLSALPTHVHPLGIEGAQLLAMAIGLCAQMASFDREAFFAVLLAHCSELFRARLEQAAATQTVGQLTALGNGIEALESVPTAIACFALNPESSEEVIGQAIFLGGDTDTIASMAGGLSGAYLGLAALPPHLVDLLESSPKGRDYLLELGSRLSGALDRASADTGD